jgi:hypothetical protein
MAKPENQPGGSGEIAAKMRRQIWHLEISAKMKTRRQRRKRHRRGVMRRRNGEK